jgi:hypothetical protein
MRSMVRNPACRNLSDRPPAPQNKSTAVNDIAHVIHLSSLILHRYLGDLILYPNRVHGVDTTAIAAMGTLTQ